MLYFDKTKVGDILQVIDSQASKYVAVGNLVRVTRVSAFKIAFENRHGDWSEFHAFHSTDWLEPTKWKKEFPKKRDAESGADATHELLLWLLKTYDFEQATVTKIRGRLAGLVGGQAALTGKQQLKRRQLCLILKTELIMFVVTVDGATSAR